MTVKRYPGSRIMVLEYQKYTPRELADKYGVTKTTIRAWLRKAKEECRTSRPKERS